VADRLGEVLIYEGDTLRIDYMQPHGRYRVSMSMFGVSASATIAAADMAALVDQVAMHLADELNNRGVEQAACYDPGCTVCGGDMDASR